MRASGTRRSRPGYRAMCRLGLESSAEVQADVEGTVEREYPKD